MNPAAHREQVEAARRDFEKLWTDTLEPMLENSFRLAQRERIVAQHIAWHAFLAGLRLPKAE